MNPNSRCRFGQVSWSASCQQSCGAWISNKAPTAGSSPNPGPAASCRCRISDSAKFRAVYLIENTRTVDLCLNYGRSLQGICSLPQFVDESEGTFLTMRICSVARAIHTDHIINTYNGLLILPLRRPCIHCGACVNQSTTILALKL